MTAVVKNPGTIWTIGYGNRNMDDFIALLKHYNLEFVVDVRSAPYSNFNSDFSKSILRDILKKRGFGYLFMGDQLGGRPDDEVYYRNDKVDYDKLRLADFFQKGIARLKVALEKQFRIVLMCSELKPEICHRARLISPALDLDGIIVKHIDEAGQLRTQQEVVDRITCGQRDLFV